jgi:hypothetical protein
MGDLAPVVSAGCAVWGSNGLLVHTSAVMITWKHAWQPPRCCCLVQLNRGWKCLLLLLLSAAQSRLDVLAFAAALASRAPVHLRL